jgi:hypothetical protein
MTTVDGQVRLRRLRWAVRGTLLLGVLASVAANVLHAQPNLVAQAIAAWPPVALFLAVEHIARVPVHRRWLAAVRLVAAGVIAGIAAYVSYVHMVAVAVRFGETGAAPWLLPVSVDGLIVVASVCLVELAGASRRATGGASGEEMETGGPRVVHGGPSTQDEMTAAARADRLTVPVATFTRATPSTREGGTR